jgi:hypothetical protein
MAYRSLGLDMGNRAILEMKIIVPYTIRPVWGVTPHMGRN